MGRFFNSPRARFRPGFVLILIVILFAMGFFLLLGISWLDFIFGLDSKYARTSTQAKLNGREDPLEKLKARANHCMENGENEEALPFLKEIHKLQTKMFGRENKETVNTLVILAEKTVVLEKHSDGLALYWQVYRIREKTLGPTHLDTLTTLQNLAHVYHLQGRNKKALRFCKDVYKHRKLLLGPTNLATMESLFLLGIFLGNLEPENLENIEKVLDYFRQGYKVFSETLGEHADKTLMVLSEIGKCLVTLKRFDEAIPTFNNIMMAAENRPQSDLYKDAETLLSVALTTLGRTEEARQLHKKAHRVKNKTGKDVQEYVSKIHGHGEFTLEVEDQLNAVLSLAKVAMAEKRYDKALEKLEQLESITHNQKEHPKRRYILENLMEVQGGLGNFKKAFELSLQLFHVVRKPSIVPFQPASAYNTNKEMANAWLNIFRLQAKVKKEHPQDFPLPDFLEVSEFFVNALELEVTKEDEENPLILRAWTMALWCLNVGKAEITLFVTSKYIQSLERQRDAEPKLKEEEIKGINLAIDTFQKLLLDRQHKKSKERVEDFDIQNHLYPDEL